MPSQRTSGPVAHEGLAARVAAELAGVAQGPKLLSDKGMWFTFLAREPCCGSRVFLNIRRRRELDDRTLEQVLLAAERNRSTRHPAVLPVRRYGCTDDFLWITTRAYRGRLLSDSLNADRAGSLPGAIGFLRQVAGPLEAVHRAGLVHGALSGSAFHCDVEGRVRVRNLEIETPILRACLEAGIATDAGLFAAPEIREGAAPEAASDQYALAAIVVRLLGVGVPVRAADLSRHGVPEPMARALLRALHPKAEDRFRSVAAMAEAFGHEEAGPAAAPPPGRRDVPETPSPSSSAGRGFGSRLRLSSDSRSGKAPVPEPSPTGTGFGGRALATAAVVFMFAATLWPVLDSRLQDSLPGAPTKASLIPEPEARDPSPSPTPAESPAPVRSPVEVPAPVELPPDPEPQPQATQEPPTPTPSRPAPTRAPAPIEPRSQGVIRATPSPAPPPAEPGGLSLQSYPWGAAYLDGTFVGNTPLMDVRVSSGTHRLRIERPGYEPYIDEVTVRPGQVLRVTGIVLEEAGR